MIAATDTWKVALMPKETVLVIHGTFAAPKQGVESWYAPGSEFCSELDERLERGGSPARCWAHLDECGEDLRKLGKRETPWFSWTGINNWLDRTAAARSLGQELAFLSKCGWRCHLVAHSHGGNVALEFFALDRRRIGLAERLVLLGTPLLTYAPRGAGREGWRQGGFHSFNSYKSYDEIVTGREDVALANWSWWTVLWVLLSVLAWIALFALVPPFLGGTEPALPRSPWVWASAIIAALAIALLQAAALLNEKVWVGLVTGTSSIHRMVWAFTPHVLFLSSERDEAYSFLSSVLRTASPFQEREPKSRPGFRTRAMVHLTSALDDDRRRYAHRARWTVPLVSLAMLCAATIIETVRPPESAGLPRLSTVLVFAPIPVLIYSIFQVPGTLTAVLLPWRALLFMRTVIVSVVRSVLLGHVKRRAWRDLQGFAFGMAGSAHRIEDVGVHRVPPEKYANGEWLYEALDPAAELFAMEQRRTAISQHVEDLLLAPDADLYDVDVWRNRVGLYASNTQLVHTVYYRHPASLDQIARFLCRPDDELVAVMRARQEIVPAAKR